MMRIIIRHTTPDCKCQLHIATATLKRKGTDGDWAGSVSVGQDKNLILSRQRANEISHLDKH